MSFNYLLCRTDNLLKELRLKSSLGGELRIICAHCCYHKYFDCLTVIFATVSFNKLETSLIIIIFDDNLFTCMYFYLAFIVFSFVYSMVVLPLFKEPMIIKSIQIMSQKSLIKIDADWNCQNGQCHTKYTWRDILLDDLNRKTSSRKIFDQFISFIKWINFFGYIDSTIHRSISMLKMLRKSVWNEQTFDYSSNSVQFCLPKWL